MLNFKMYVTSMTHHFNTEIHIVKSTWTLFQLDESTIKGNLTSYILWVVMLDMYRQILDYVHNKRFVCACSKIQTPKKYPCEASKVE